MFNSNWGKRYCKGTPSAIFCLPIITQEAQLANTKLELAKAKEGIKKEHEQRIETVTGTKKEAQLNSFLSYFRKHCSNKEIWN